MKKVSFKTLGCRLNQYETDALVTEFHKGGYEIVDFSEKADVCVINTCTVTNQSDQKSRNIVSQAAGKNPGSMVVVAGCMVNNYKSELERNEDITYVVDNEHKNSIFSLVDAHFKGEILHPDQLPSNIFGYETVDKSLHTRTSIKIQDGCDNFCTFCIIPSVRGRAVSRNPQEIYDNIKRVYDNGFREMVITGVNIGRYDYNGLKFENLLENILEIPGDFRIRISSIEPDGFGPGFSSLFSHPKLTPHLHLCLQSGSDQILLKMRRMYNVRSFMDIVHQFRKLYPDFNFTTDIIVGFPGETDQDFAKTLDIAREAAFSHIHTFRYSTRKGTRAERMENQVSAREKSARSAMVREISDFNKEAYYKSMLGKTQRVLVEKVRRGNLANGYGENYLPVTFADASATRNSFVDVKLESVSENKLLAVRV
ncbi:MAG: tRNA (N(6)-L-threonylcarbamoyladenosine(37)-C(2))-methylthiotransferase MtaB [Bacteroidales bacterium]|nr:tRNA (N(6)-L-threonylcarbamoyladenosine(37)-C(2))-methylthiotransferase MtaB [Bacteroidales bacterium]MCB8999164.1 tRNA (N(6)-L-threonylcarbamoyladenosine(37)-C(2))-methylthiotransferase MtaB [Bacteroidales bacterium]